MCNVVDGVAASSIVLILGLVCPADVDRPKASRSKVCEERSIRPDADEEDDSLKLTHSSAWGWLRGKLIELLVRLNNSIA